MKDNKKLIEQSQNLIRIWKSTLIGITDIDKPMLDNIKREEDAIKRLEEEMK